MVVVVATVIAVIIAVPLAVIQSRGVSSPIATTTVRNRVLITSVIATVVRTNKSTANNKSSCGIHDTGSYKEVRGLFS